jgi:D-arabinose 1-dehydrogenase-like Zn-dependent alcohol dehydrogenase
MRAMLLEVPGRPLREAELPVPEAASGQVLVRVRACGVCRTDLHVADGELAEPKLPLVLGHQIVGEDVESGERLQVGLSPRAVEVYRERLAEWCQRVERYCAARGLRYARLATDEPLEQAALVTLRQAGILN